LLVFPYGFGVAEGGFKGMKPWEEEHKRKNERERPGSEERVREGESGLLGLDPHLKSLSLLFFSFFFFFWYYSCYYFRSLVQYISCGHRRT